MRQVFVSKDLSSFIKSKLTPIFFLLSLSAHPILANNLSLSSPLDIQGLWHSAETGKEIFFHKFQNTFHGHVRSYYEDGSPSDYFFQFNIEPHAKPGDIIIGQIRSLDGYYNCAFEESAELQIGEQGQINLRYILLRFHLRTTSEKLTSKEGWISKRFFDWTDWGWVETTYLYPIEKWRTIKNECIVDAKTWSQQILTR